MSKAIGTARVLPTATVDGAEIVQHPGNLGSATTHRIPIAGMPACPAWCVGDCLGGEAEHLGNGVVIHTDRLHTLTLADMTVVDGDSYRGSRTIDLRLFVERYDTLDPSEELIRTRVLFEVDKVKLLAPTSDQMRELAHWLLGAADLMDAADAAEGR